MHRRIRHRIADPASLEAAARLPRCREIEFALPGLPAERAERLGRRATSLSCACGCDVAAITITAAVLLCIVADLAFWPVVSARPFSFAGLNLLACFLSIGLGKAIGRANARHELLRLYAAVNIAYVKGS